MCHIEILQTVSEVFDNTPVLVTRLLSLYDFAQGMIIATHVLLTCSRLGTIT